MNTVLYIRVSTQEQADEGFSIEAQKDRLINFCKAREWDVVDIYVDPGYSGSSLERPAMQKLIHDAQEKLFDNVLVYKLDRLSRSQKDTLYLIEDVFLKHNIGFVSMQESFDTSTAFGRAMIGILSVFAQLERENIRERGDMGRRERAKQGWWSGGRTPIGYDYVDGELVPNEKAEIIRKIFDMYIEGDGAFRIKVATGFTHESSVLCILKSPVYAGKIVYNDEVFDGLHEPLISYETFLNVQRLRETRTKRRGHRIKHNPFAGLLLCKNCGATYYRSTGGGSSVSRYYYTCYSRGYKTRRGKEYMVKDKNCKNKIWRAEVLEKMVFDEIKMIACNKEKLHEILNTHTRHKSDIVKVRRDIKTIDSKISKLMDLYLDDKIPAEALKVKIDDLSTKKSILQETIEAETHKEDNAAWLKTQFSNIAMSLDSLDPENQRALLATVIDNIELDGDSAKINWRVV